MHAYVVVAKENEDLLRGKLPPSVCTISQRMVIGESLILHLSGIRSVHLQQLENWFNEEGIAYNVTEHHDVVAYWPDAVRAMRYDAQGSQVYTTSLGHEPEGLREVLHHLIVTETNEAREKDRMFHAYMVCIGFNDQARLGKLHRMRKLVGGL